MAHFYANIQGNRGEATRMGTASSGISGHVRGWSTGACVDALSVNGRLVPEGGQGDRVDVTRTRGSNGGGNTGDAMGWVDDGPAWFSLNGVGDDECRSLAAKLEETLRHDPAGPLAGVIAEACALLARLAPDPAVGRASEAA